MKRKHVTLDAARRELQTGDLLLYGRDRRSLISRLIAAAGRGEWSHAAKFAWWNSDGFVFEVREWYGGRAILLAREVRRRPGLIDVFETNANHRPDFDRVKANAAMRRFAGCDYGYTGVLLAGLLHLPVIRLFVRPDTEDSAANVRPPFCSHAISIADRAGGVDPVPWLADRITEPSDLARSRFYKYRFTLIP